MATKTDTFITENFDCFTLKNNNGNGAIYLSSNKNLMLYKDNKLASFSEAEAANFINYYPDAAPFYDYYPFSAFISEDKKLEVLLFCEHDASEEKSSFIIQTLYNKKPVAKFSLTETFGLNEIIDNGIVNISDGFSGLKAEGYFTITVFRKPKGTSDDYGTINIDKTGKITLFTGSGIP